MSRLPWSSAPEGPFRSGGPGRTRARRAVLACAAALAVSACGPDPGNLPLLRDAVGAGDVVDVPDASDDSDVDADAPSDPDASDLEPWDTEGAGPLSGFFAAEIVVPANAVVDVESRILARVRVLHFGQELLQSTTICRLALPSVQGVATVRVAQPLEDLLRSSPDEQRTEALSSPEAVGAVYHHAIRTLVLGADLEDPDGGTLPADAADPAVTDADGDGSPGVSLAVETIVCPEPEDLHVVLRVGAIFDGTVEDEDTIAGAASAVVEYTVLGFTDPCMEAAARLPIEILDGATFRAVRAAPEDDADGDGNVDCDEVVASAPRQFGEFWVPE